MKKNIITASVERTSQSSLQLNSPMDELNRLESSQQSLVGHFRV